MSEPTGVWFVYGQDWNAYPTAVFNDELEARRWKDENAPTDMVVFWKFGVDWRTRNVVVGVPDE